MRRWDPETPFGTGCDSPAFLSIHERIPIVERTDIVARAADGSSESPAPKRSTYERALDMLEARARGVAELRRLLIRKGEPESDVTQRSSG